MEIKRSDYVYVANVSRIMGFDRISFSMVINDLVEQYPEYKATNGNFEAKQCGIPEDHILNKWVEWIKEVGWWMPWMNEINYAALYLTEQVEVSSD